jgi:vesicle coat complex subunit
MCMCVANNNSEKIPLIAPDCLRKLAKSFADEDESVKHQILNLAVKLYQSNPKQTALLFKVTPSSYLYTPLLLCCTRTRTYTYCRNTNDKRQTCALAICVSVYDNSISWIYVDLILVMIYVIVHVCSVHYSLRRKILALQRIIKQM